MQDYCHILNREISAPVLTTIGAMLPRPQFVARGFRCIDVRATPKTPLEWMAELSFTERTKDSALGPGLDLIVKLPVEVTELSVTTWVIHSQQLSMG